MKKEPIYWAWVIFMSGISFLIHPILGVGLLILCIAAVKNEEKQYENMRVDWANELTEKYKELFAEVDDTFVPERYTCTKEEWKLSLAEHRVRSLFFSEADELDALREADEEIWEELLKRFGYEHDEIYNVYFSTKPSGILVLKHTVAKGYKVLIPSTDAKKTNGGEIIVVRFEDILREIEKFRRENQHDGRV